MDEARFGLVISSISNYQLEVIKHGFFVRGGFTLGKMYMDKNIVFGVPVIEAVEIEKSLAVFPRIVLSELLVMLVQHHLTYYADVRESPQQRNLLCDVSNGGTVVFVNYLGSAIDGDWYESVLDLQVLRQHRDLVTSNLARYQEDEKVGPKYTWLAGYHNYFCDWMSKAGVANYEADLPIPGIAPLANLRTVIEALPPNRIPGLT